MVRIVVVIYLIVFLTLSVYHSYNLIMVSWIRLDHCRTVVVEEWKDRISFTAKIVGDAGLLLLLSRLLGFQDCCAVIALKVAVIWNFVVVIDIVAIPRAFLLRYCCCVTVVANSNTVAALLLLLLSFCRCTVTVATSHYPDLELLIERDTSPLVCLTYTWEKSYKYSNESSFFHLDAASGYNL